MLSDNRWHMGKLLISNTFLIRPLLGSLGSRVAAATAAARRPDVLLSGRITLRCPARPSLPHQGRWRGTYCAAWPVPHHHRWGPLCRVTPDPACRGPQSQGTAYLLDVGTVGSINTIFQLTQTASFSKGKNKFSLYIGFMALFSGHLQEFNQILPIV